MINDNALNIAWCPQIVSNCRIINKSYLIALKAASKIRFVLLLNVPKTYYHVTIWY